MSSQLFRLNGGGGLVFLISFHFSPQKESVSLESRKGPKLPLKYGLGNTLRPPIELKLPSTLSFRLNFTLMTNGALQI